jgi:hypothetical protein
LSSLYCGTASNGEVLIGTVVSGTAVQLTSNYSGSSYNGATLYFYVTDTAGNESAEANDAYSGGNYARGLRVGSSSSSLSTTVAKSSYLRPSTSVPTVPISFVDTATAFTARAQAAQTQADERGQAVDVGYASPASVKTSPMDTSGLSLFRRSATSAGKAAGAKFPGSTVPAVDARYTGSPASETRAAESVAAPADGSAVPVRGAAAAPSPAAVAATQTGASGQVGAAAPSGENAPKLPSQPTAPVQGPDLYIGPSGGGRRENREPCDGVDESDIL